MSFAAKVDALRRFLGVPPSLQMVQAVVLMNEMMGVIGEGPLPAQVEALITATIGWHCGVLQRRVTDGRIKRGGQQCNFYVYYEVDDDEVPTVLPLDAYGIDEECGWWLLEETGANV